jgi:hypothetical protein
MTQKLINLKGDTYLEQMGNAIFIPGSMAYIKPIKIGRERKHKARLPLSKKELKESRNWLEKAIKKVKVENLVDKSKH